MVTYVKISELPIATEATGDSELEVNQAGVTRKITVDQIADVIAEILPPPDMSDYATDEELADAIAAIPAADWNTITGKPSTFPPTTPIPYTSISGTPTSLPPSGTAGGDLAGTYPNPLIKPGTNTQILTTVAGVAAWAAAPSSAPSGAAGGDLAGTYPNPTIKSAVALAGAPTTTTAATADSTTKIATTAFVKAQNYITSSSIPASLPPSGTAGGDLSGTYPNPLVKPSVTNGQVLTTVAGVAAWAAAAGGGASVTISDTAPSSPSAGNLWWESDSGKLLIYFNDGSTSQWVEANSSAGPPGVWVQMTQAAYDALTPKVATTLYVIVG